MKTKPKIRSSGQTNKGFVEYRRDLHHSANIVRGHSVALERKTRGAISQTRDEALCICREMRELSNRLRRYARCLGPTPIRSTTVALTNLSDFAVPYGTDKHVVPAWVVKEVRKILGYLG